MSRWKFPLPPKWPLLYGKIKIYSYTQLRGGANCEISCRMPQIFRFCCQMRRVVVNFTENNFLYEASFSNLISITMFVAYGFSEQIDWKRGRPETFALDCCNLVRSEFLDALLKLQLC